MYKRKFAIMFRRLIENIFIKHLMTDTNKTLKQNDSWKVAHFLLKRFHNLLFICTMSGCMATAVFACLRGNPTWPTCLAVCRYRTMGRATCVSTAVAHLRINSKSVIKFKTKNASVNNILRWTNYQDKAMKNRHHQTNIIVVVIIIIICWIFLEWPKYCKYC